MLLLTNPVQFGKDVKKGYDELTSEEAKNVYRKILASPNTAIGLTYGASGYLYGAATGKDVKVSIGNNAVQFEGNPFGQDGAAVTLGNTISYFGSARASDTHPTYEANKPGYVENLTNTVILGKHEQEHTYQYEKLGPYSYQFIQFTESPIQITHLNKLLTKQEINFTGTSMANKLTTISAFLLLLGCNFLPIDRSSKWGGGREIEGKMCSWYIDQQRKMYCAYNDHKDDPIKLKYEECASCEKYIRSLNK